MQSEGSSAVEDLFAVPVNSHHLVFSPRRNLAAVVNTTAAEALSHWAATSENNRAEIVVLRDLVGSLREPPATVAIHAGPARPVFLGLVVTRACNMACRYCDFLPEQSSRSMTPELAVSAINAWVRHQQRVGEHRLELHFFGGEPFVQGDLVQIAVHHTRALAARHGMTTHFEASTNGLMKERDLEFVRRHFDAIVLSLDGPQPDQDRHRPLTGGRSGFEQVCQTARALSDSPVELCIRCCVSQTNMAHLPATAEWFANEFQPSVVDFEPLSETEPSVRAGLVPPHPYAFATGFIRARRILQAAGIQCVYAAAPEKPRRVFCPVGQDAFIVSPAGSVRSCYLRQSQWKARGLDLEIGQITSGDMFIDLHAVERLRSLAADRLRCTTCFCRWTCAGGCLVREADAERAGRRTNFCRLTRLVQACVLLEDMGQPHLVDQLLGDSEAMDALSGQADDRLGTNGA